MTTENQNIEQSTSSSLTNVDSSSKMQGWYKLRDTIRKSGPSINPSIRSFPNNNLNNRSLRQQNFFPVTTNTNGHTFRATEIIHPTITLDSPPNIFNSPSIISVTSTPRQIIDDIPSVETEPLSTPRSRRGSIPLTETESTTATGLSSSSSTSMDSKQSPKHSKKITIRKSNKSKEPSSTIKPIEISTPITEDISDDDMPLVDIRKHKTKSIDTLSIPSVPDSIIPLATDLQSLPGHTQEENRDIRFINYTDIDSLATHLNTCLYIDKKSFSPTKQYIFKSRYNVLNKIFKIYYIKTFRRHLFLKKKSFFNKKDQQKQQPLSVISSPTSTSFKMDWAVNRRNSSSTHRQTPNNIFHVLQINPKNAFSSSNNSSASTSKSPIQTFERIKDVLARTYYPHLYTAIEYGYQFGAKTTFPNTHQLISTHDDIIPVKEMPQSPSLIDDSITITLKSPPSTARRDSPITQQSPSITKKRERNRNDSKIDGVSLSSISIDRRTSEEIEEVSPLIIKKSIVVLTPTQIPIPSPPLIDKETKLINNRKRKSSTITNTPVLDKKKKRIISSTAPEIVNHFEDISDPESEEDLLPSQLPKQCCIKNGLRSNYYKTRTDNDSKSVSTKSRVERRRRQSSGSLPSFYTGIFESDDEKSPHIDYCLPYDIYWFEQQQQQQVKQTTVNNSSSSVSTSTFQHQKKKSSKPKQKQPVPYKKIFRNVYSDQLKSNLLSTYTTEKAPVCDCKPPETCEDGVCLNKIIFTECLANCACGTKCSNQKIRKNQWSKHLEIFETSKYGQGVRTTASIPKGTLLCEYVGEIITDEKFHERMTNLYSKDEHHYTMKLTQNLVIDAYRMGSIARFANHSCSPNCEFQKWTVDGLQRMCMFPLRTIKAGEEITYDYNFQCFNLQAQQPCYCESPKCRGKIGAKQQTTSSSTTTTTNNTNNNHSTTIQRLTQREKRMVLQSSIFLLRNLRRLKEKQELRENNSYKLKQQTDKQSAISLFLAQNYYHSNGSNNSSTLASLRKTPKLIHKDIFYLFYNHIRRSHFVKTGRYQNELIDETCYYAQLAQFTLILNEIFELILHYRSINEDITPSNVLKKCPSKRLFPAYYEIITKPIDLTMIRNRLDNGEYSSFHLFQQDLALLFKNAITYCGGDSDEAQAVLELQDYFLHTLKIEYQNKLNLFINMKEEDRNSTNLLTLENFITRLHEKEVIDGQIREILYDIIYNIDDTSNINSPIVYKIVLANNNNSHRLTRTKTSSDCIVHCRCGSVYDENSLVQCYACQLWQHVACVSIADPSRPYYCFECQPACEHNPSACLKTNVLIAATLSPLQTYDDNHSSYSTLTRSDGFIIRINECYFVPKQEENNIDRSLTSPEYDILCIERLWIDDYGIGQASGFYYIRPNETFHEPTRKFFPNEVFRFPSSNDPLPISSMVRPCFVFDVTTYCKGKPISDNSSRVLLSDMFICDFRVDKAARTFTRVSKSRQFAANTKSYCFDSYVEKPVIKRTYQPYEKELQQQQYQDNRRRAAANPNKLNNKKLKEKRTRINGFIEKIYCRFHDQHLMPHDTKYSIDQLLHQSSTSSILINEDKSPHKPDLKEKNLSTSSPLQFSAGNISKKRRTISLSSDDDIVELMPENACQRLSKKRSTKPTIINSRKRDEFLDQI